MQICEINWEDEEERNKSEETLISIIATFYEYYRYTYEWKCVL